MNLGPKRFLNIRQRPFELFGLAAVLLFILWLIPTRDSLDINMHDTYSPFPLGSHLSVTAVLFLFAWLIYFVINGFLFSKKLTWAHTLLTVITTTLLLVFVTFKDMMPGARRYYAYSEGPDIIQDQAVIITGLLIILGVFQLILIFNIIAGFIKRLIRSY